jgi:hypothetical protein
MSGEWICLCLYSSGETSLQNNQNNEETLQKWE